MTTYGAASDANFVKMTTFSFQCKPLPEPVVIQFINAFMDHHAQVKEPNGPMVMEKWWSVLYVYFPSTFNGRYYVFQWKYIIVQNKSPRWYYANTGSGNGFVSLGNKSSREKLLPKHYDTIWRLQNTLGW